MLQITREQVEQSLTVEGCIPLMAEALTLLSSEGARQMVRVAMPIEGRNVLGIMPAMLASRGICGVKVLSVFPDNARQGIPSHQGQIVVFENRTGRLRALVDAEAITAVRTAAASAVATNALARADAGALAILGAGLQGRRHLMAMLAVRNITGVTVWDIRPEASEAFAKEMAECAGVAVRTCRTAAEAVRGADIICTVTPAVEPLICLADIKKGAHINAVGACSANAREIASDIMAASRLFVDKLDAALIEAGDILLAIADGVITGAHIVGEVGSVLMGKVPGRVGPDDITLFEALGQATEDLVAADYVINRYQNEA